MTITSLEQDPPGLILDRSSVAGGGGVPGAIWRGNCLRYLDVPLEVRING